MKFLIFSLFSKFVFAIPDTVEVWFLSDKKHQLFDLLSNKSEEAYIFSGKLAELPNFHANCTMTGSYFYHKFFGIHDHLGEKESVLATPIVSNKLSKMIKERQFKGARAQFLGVTNTNKVSIWVDVSSSMKDVDPRKKGTCYRKRLVNSLKKERSCQMKLFYYTLDAGISNLKTTDDLCSSHGISDEKRLRRLLTYSNDEYVLIITDISQLSLEFSEFLGEINADVVGYNLGRPLKAKEMMKGQKFRNILNRCTADI